jgi:hypothetical protein
MNVIQKTTQVAQYYKKPKLLFICNIPNYALNHVDCMFLYVRTTVAYIKLAHVYMPETV